MIYTVTLNPSVDYIVEVEHFEIDSLNRISREAKYPGGKGINVSRVLNRIGVETKALGFIGGFTGYFIKNTLEQESVPVDFIEVNGDSRINIKLKTGKETEINGQGPAITEAQFQQLMKKLEDIPAGDIVVLAGSIPSSLPFDLYERLTESCSERGIKVVVDASGKALLDVVTHRPFLVKPNHHELGELFDTTIDSIDDVLIYGKKLVEMGAEHVVVSMAGDGAILLTKDAAYRANVPKGKVINSVGAGDSLVAGFVGMYWKSTNILQAFQYGVATGSATAFSADLCTKEKIGELLPQVEIQKI
jgi:1-phosphofructokinase